MKTTAVFLLLVAAASTYTVPSYTVQSTKVAVKEADEVPPPQPYDFRYNVEDAETANKFNQEEKSDGNTVTGIYRVALPDGRTQIVKYTASRDNGFVADVTYEGVARYSDPPAAKKQDYAKSSDYKPADKQQQYSRSY